MDTSDLCQAELKILDALSLLQSKPSMAPRLHVLHWSGSHMMYANLFAGPFLQAVNLQSLGLTGVDHWDAPATLANVIHSSPVIESLRVLDILGKQTSRTLATLDSTSWSKLRLLDLQTDTSPEFVPILGRLPVLEDLQINFGSRSGHPGFIPSPSEPLFPRLKSLRAFGTDLSSIPIQLLLGHGSAPHLTGISLMAEDDEPTAYFLQDWFTTFLSNRPALRDISVFVPTVELTLESQATLDTIQPLFTLKKLVNLAITLPFALDDNALSAIAKGWPSLQILDLGGTNHPHYHTSVTLSGIVQLVANTPRLENLSLNFDASDVAAAWKDRQDIEGACVHLRELCAGGSRILDAPAVAKFLGNVFPRVRVTEDDPNIWDADIDPDGIHYREKWRHVRALLRASVVAADAAT